MKKLNDAMRVSWISIGVNIILSLMKAAAGLIGHSGAMISDAIHSASDVFSTIIVMIGIRISGRDSDKGHPYGHERMECIASIILAVLLFLTGAGVGISGGKVILSGNFEAIAVPGKIALWAAVVSIAVKEWMFQYTKHTAKKLNSTSLMADAWHHRSDALSSVGSFIGIFGSILGAPVLDSVAQVVICIFILKAAVDIFNDATSQMVDHACDPKIEEEIRATAARCPGVLSIDDLKTRVFGSRIYTDLEIGTDGNLTLWEAHAIAERVHNAIEIEVPNVKHCMVHVNPKSV